MCRHIRRVSLYLCVSVCVCVWHMSISNSSISHKYVTVHCIEMAHPSGVNQVDVIPTLSNTESVELHIYVNTQQISISVFL